MAGSQQRTYTNFAGGQNNYSGQYAGPIIVDNGGIEALAFAHASTNWLMQEYGLIKQAGNISVLTNALSGTPTITGEYDWNGTHILCGGGKVYTVGGGVATQIYTGATAGKYYQFTEYEDASNHAILIMCNGTDKPLYYDGTTCTTITFTDDASVIWNDARPQGCMAFRGSLFYWGDATHPHRIYKPQPGSYNNFDNTDSDVEAFDVDPGFGGNITGLKPLTNDIAIIYKDHCIRRMSGVNPFGAEVDPINYTTVTDEYGCIAPRTIVQVNGDHFFMSSDGMRRLLPGQNYGDLDAQRPTYPIQGLIDALNFTAADMINACAVYHKPSKQVWLSAPNGSSTTNNAVFLMNVETGANSPRAVGDIVASTLAIFNKEVYTGNYAGQTYKNGDDYTYNGVTIDAEWESKWIAHNGLGFLKCYRELHIYADVTNAGSLVVQYATLKRGVSSNQSHTEAIATQTSLWDQAVFDVSTFAESGQVCFKIKNLGKGNALKLKFINLTSDQQISIRQVDLFYDVFGTARG